MKVCLKALAIPLLVIGALFGVIGVSYAQEAQVKIYYYSTPEEYTELTGEKITEYNEAPELAELVKQGKLPPVEERLPGEPLVVNPLEEIGKYGGVYREQVWTYKWTS